MAEQGHGQGLDRTPEATQKHIQEQSRIADKLRQEAEMLPENSIAANAIAALLAGDEQSLEEIKAQIGTTPKAKGKSREKPAADKDAEKHHGLANQRDIAKEFEQAMKEAAPGTERVEPSFGATASLDTPVYEQEPSLTGNDALKTHNQEQVDVQTGKMLNQTIQPIKKGMLEEQVSQLPEREITDIDPSPAGVTGSSANEKVNLAAELGTMHDKGAAMRSEQIEAVNKRANPDKDKPEPSPQQQGQAKQSQYNNLMNTNPGREGSTKTLSSKEVEKIKAVLGEDFAALQKKIGSGVNKMESLGRVSITEATRAAPQGGIGKVAEKATAGKN